MELLQSSSQELRQCLGLVVDSLPVYKKPWVELYKLGVVAHRWYSSTWEVEEGGVQGQPLIHS